MIRSLAAALALLVLLLALLLAPAARAEVIVGTVDRIFDGDSLIVIEGGALSHEVRIAGIDAPEKKQPYSQVARRQLEQLTRGRMLTVEAYKRDRYGRLVGSVTADGLDVGLAMVSAGLAWHDRRHLAEQRAGDAQRYTAAEADARAARLGLWRQAHPMPPWEWRQRHPRGGAGLD